MTFRYNVLQIDSKIDGRLALFRYLKTRGFRACIEENIIFT